MTMNEEGAVVFFPAWGKGANSAEWVLEAKAVLLPPRCLRAPNDPR
jgi:hypothetical protein